MPINLIDSPVWAPVTVPAGGDLATRAGLIEAYQDLANRDALLKQYRDQVFCAGVQSISGGVLILQQIHNPSGSYVIDTSIGGTVRTPSPGPYLVSGHIACGVSDEDDSVSLEITTDLGVSSDFIFFTSPVSPVSPNNRMRTASFSAIVTTSGGTINPISFLLKSAMSGTFSYAGSGTSSIVIQRMP